MLWVPNDTTTLWDIVRADIGVVVGDMGEFNIRPLFRMIELVANWQQMLSISFLMIFYEKYWPTIIFPYFCG